MANINYWPVFLLIIALYNFAINTFNSGNIYLCSHTTNIAFMFLNYAWLNQKNFAQLLIQQY